MNHLKTCLDLQWRTLNEIRSGFCPLEKALIDLRKLNQEVKEQGFVGHDFLSGLATKFYVIQWRGIHYFTTQWSQKDRREHRQSSQIVERLVADIPLMRLHQLLVLLENQQLHYL